MAKKSIMKNYLYNLKIKKYEKPLYNLGICDIIWTKEEELMLCLKI